MAGGVAPSDGVKLMYEQPRSSAAIAYSELAGSGHFCGLSSSLFKLAPIGRQRVGVDRRLGRGHVDHDHVGQLVASATNAFRSACTRSIAARGVSRRLRSSVVGEFFDRRADVEQRARADVLFDLVQIGFALGQDARRRWPGFRCASAALRRTAGRRGCRGRRRRSLSSRPDRSGANCGNWLTRPAVADQPFLERRQPDQGRRGDAPFGANEPNADARASHAESISSG